MSGGYFTGSIVTLREDNTENDNSEILLDAIRTRKYYTYYNQQNLINADVLSKDGLFAVDAAVIPPMSTAWIYEKYTHRVHFEFWHDQRGILAGEVTTFNTYAYTRNEIDNKYYYLNIMDMEVYPNINQNHLTRALTYSLDSGNSNFVLTEYGPRIQPESNTFTYSFGTDISNNGLNGNIGVSYTVTKDDLVIRNNEATTFKAFVHFDYPFKSILGLTYGPSDYSKENTQQVAYAIHRREGSGSKTFQSHPQLSVYFSEKTSLTGWTNHGWDVVGNSLLCNIYPIDGCVY